MLQNGAIIDVMHLLVALAAIAITIGLAYNPGVRHGELAAAAAPVGVMKKQCKPGDVFAVLSDKGGTRIVPLAVNDKRYPNGVVWYRDNVGGWKPLPCKSSPEDAFEQAEQEARAATAKEKADTAEFKRDSAAPHPPTGITSEDIGPRDELKPSSTPPEGLDVARKLEELATSPEDARTPRATALEQGNDVSQYIAELKQRSLTPRDDAPAQPQVPQMQDQPASDRTGLEEPSVPLPRERPSAWSRLWSDTPRAIRDFVTNEWDSLTGVPTAPRMNGPDPSAVVADRFLGASEFPQTPLEPSDVINTGRPLAEVLGLPREIAGYTPEQFIAALRRESTVPSLPPPTYTPDFNSVFSDVQSMQSAPLQAPVQVQSEPSTLSTLPTQAPSQTAYPVSPEMQAAYDRGPARAYTPSTMNENRWNYFRETSLPPTLTPTIH